MTNPALVHLPVLRGSESVSTGAATTEPDEERKPFFEPTWQPRGSPVASLAMHMEGGSGSRVKDADGVLPAPGLRSVRVLVVDDEALNRRLLRRMLERGCGITEVDEADDGPAAVAMWREAARGARPYDLCMMDIVLLTMRGDAALAQMQDESRHSTGELPVPVTLACTGNAGEADLRSYEAQGFDGVLAKPFSMEELRAMVRERLT